MNTFTIDIVMFFGQLNNYNMFQKKVPYIRLYIKLEKLLTSWVITLFRMYVLAVTQLLPTQLI